MHFFRFNRNSEVFEITREQTERDVILVNDVDKSCKPLSTAVMETRASSAAKIEKYRPLKPVVLSDIEVTPN